MSQRRSKQIEDILAKARSELIYFLFACRIRALSGFLFCLLIRFGLREGERESRRAHMMEGELLVRDGKGRDLLEESAEVVHALLEGIAGTSHLYGFRLLQVRKLLLPAGHILIGSEQHLFRLGISGQILHTARNAVSIAIHWSM